MDIKKNTWVIFLLLIVLIVGFWLWISFYEKNSPATPVVSDTILFYGKECPHCIEVEKYIKDNQIEEKVAFDSLEIWHNKANSEIMLKKAQECGFEKDQLGVPFLYSKGKCYVGGPQVQNFFKKEAGL